MLRNSATQIINEWPKIRFRSQWHNKTEVEGQPWAHVTAGHGQGQPLGHELLQIRAKEGNCKSILFVLCLHMLSQWFYNRHGVKRVWDGVDIPLPVCVMHGESHCRRNGSEMREWGIDSGKLKLDLHELLPWSTKYSFSNHQSQIIIGRRVVMWNFCLMDVISRYWLSDGLLPPHCVYHYTVKKKIK